MFSFECGQNASVEEWTKCRICHKDKPPWEENYEKETLNFYHLTEDVLVSACVSLPVVYVEKSFLGDLLYFVRQTLLGTFIRTVKLATFINYCTERFEKTRKRNFMSSEFRAPMFLLSPGFRIDDSTQNRFNPMLSELALPIKGSPTSCSQNVFLILPKAFQPCAFRIYPFKLKEASQPLGRL